MCARAIISLCVCKQGFSLFALRDGTDDKWREYRFPFQVLSGRVRM